MNLPAGHPPIIAPRVGVPTNHFWDDIDPSIGAVVEAAIDRISLDLHPLSKNAKDMGSAAQFVALSLIGVVWACILLG